MEPVGLPLVDLASLPGFARWQAVNPGYTLARHAYPAIQPDQFFAIGSLLWPTLVRHAGGLFLEDGFSVPSFDQWLGQTSSLTATERVMNHRHMRDMLRSFNDAPRDVLLSAENFMQQCWKGRLNQLCPDTPAIIRVHETDSDVEITFHVVRSDETGQELVGSS